MLKHPRCPAASCSSRCTAGWCCRPPVSGPTRHPRGSCIVQSSRGQQECHVLVGPGTASPPRWAQQADARPTLSPVGPSNRSGTTFLTQHVHTLLLSCMLGRMQPACSMHPRPCADTLLPHHLRCNSPSCRQCPHMQHSHMQDTHRSCSHTHVWRGLLVQTSSRAAQAQAPRTLARGEQQGTARPEPGA
jgi:hypothetical protein